MPKNSRSTVYLSYSVTFLAANSNPVVDDRNSGCLFSRNWPSRLFFPTLTSPIIKTNHRKVKIFLLKYLAAEFNTTSGSETEIVFGAFSLLACLSLFKIEGF